MKWTVIWTEVLHLWRPFCVYTIQEILRCVINTISGPSSCNVPSRCVGSVNEFLPESLALAPPLLPFPHVTWARGPSWIFSSIWGCRDRNHLRWFDHTWKTHSDKKKGKREQHLRRKKNYILMVPLSRWAETVQINQQRYWEACVM